MSLDVVKQWTMLDIYLLKQLLNKHSCQFPITPLYHATWQYLDGCWTRCLAGECSLCQNVVCFFVLKQSLWVCAVCFILFIMFLFLSKSTWNNVPQSPTFCPPPNYQDWLHSSGTQCSMWTVRYLSALWVISFYLPYLAHYQVITQ